MSKKEVKKKLELQNIWKKKSFWVILVIAFLAIVGIAFLIITKSKQSQANRQFTIKSETVEKGDISTSIEGSGYLETADTTSINVPMGITIKKVLVSSGDSVKKGQKLAKVSKSSVAAQIVVIQEEIEEIDEQLSDSSSSYETVSLKAKKKDAQKVLKTLKALYNSPYIKATKAGVVSTVNVAENSDTSSISTSQSGSSESGSAGASKMSANTNSGKTASVVTLSTLKTNSEEAASAVTLSTTGTTDMNVAALNEKKISDFKDLTITKPEEGKAPQETVKETTMYSGNITWDCNGKFQSGTVYTATIVLMAKDGYVFDSGSLPTIAGATVEGNVYNSGKTMIVKVEFEATKEGNTTKVQNVQEQKQETNKAYSESGQGNKSTGANISTTNDNYNTSAKSANSGSNVSSNSGLVSSSNASVGTSNSSSNSSTTNSQYFTSAFEISPNNKAKVSLSVDELDISAVKNGQTATITLDAVEDKEFEGTITKVSNMGTVSSGSTKYTVEITIKMTSDMKIGMTASATINISQATDVLKISMNALQQMGDKTFVYTSADNDGNLSGEVTVETGESDGNNVEIISGLNEGDTVYYTRTTSSSEDKEKGFGNMNFDRDNMPEDRKNNFKGGEGMPQGGRSFN